MDSIGSASKREDRRLLSEKKKLFFKAKKTKTRLFGRAHKESEVLK